MGSLFTSKTTQESEPYEPAQPAINTGIEGIQNLYESGGFNIAPYQGQRVAGISPEEQMGLDMTRYGAMTGFQNLGNMQDVVSNVASYGPQDTSMLRDMAMNDAMNAVQDQFRNAGMEAGSLHQSEATEAAARGVAPWYYDAVNQDLNRQLRAASIMPGLTAAQTGQAAAATQAGARETGQTQAELNAMRQQYEEEQRAPITEQQLFQQLAGAYGGMGGTVTGTSRGSPFEIAGQVLGMATGLYGGMGGMGGGFGAGMQGVPTAGSQYMIPGWSTPGSF